ncbi:RNA-directed DNA polymerase, eukaryota, reverse transcriptase zinc-binding domain protein [Tanacetum coccineum]
MPHDVVKLILFPFSLKGAAETWLENELPNSITTWDDLVSKFLNRFYPHSKTRKIINEITNFQQGVLPSNTITDPHAELKAITTMDGLTLDGSLIPHSNILIYQEEEQEPETITEVVKIPSSQSTSLVPPPKTPPLSTPKPKENLELNPHQPLIPYPSRFQKDKFQALENPTGRADHFIYRIDIVDSLCDKFPIEKNSLSGNPTTSSDLVVASLSPSPTPCRDSDFILGETDTLLSHFDDSLPAYEAFCFDIREKSSGSTTSQSNHSLPDYEAFYFDVDHIEEKSSGSTISHSDLSLLEYDSFHFDLSFDPVPPTDRSDSQHEEFVDELAHIISPLEYDRFYFDAEADP